MRQKYFFYRIGLSIGISTLQYAEGFLFLRALSSRTGFNTPRPSFPRERVRGLRETSEK